jgi:hypothetical protein
MKLNIFPFEFAYMDSREKAFIIACINKKMEADKNEEQRLKHAGKGKKGRRRR